MVPVTHNCYPYGYCELHARYPPMFPLHPDHVLVYCLCPCGTHTTHFAMDRNALLNRMMRVQAINGRGYFQPQLQGQQEQYRLRRPHSRKDTSDMTYLDEMEEEVDR
nr:PREDICTED: uncharacterized protein LOC105662996 [Megachile rotundata]